DVFGRRTAATTHDLRTRLYEMARVRRHVLGARHVHAAAADVARHAGVRLSAELPSRLRRHLLDAFENRLRTDGAIQTDDIRAPAIENTHDVFGRRAIRRAAIRTDRHLRDDRLLRCDGARGANGLLDLLEIGERLDD